MTNRGFTLLEFMVATSIGTLVVGGVFFVMTTQTQANRQQAELVESQQNVRSAMVDLSDAIRQTGFGVPGKYAFGGGFKGAAGYDYAMVNNFSGTDIYGTCADTDVFTVISRKPVGYWQFVSTTSGSLTLRAGPPVLPSPTVWLDGGWKKGELLLLSRLDLPLAGMGVAGDNRAGATNGSNQTVPLLVGSGAPSGFEQAVITTGFPGFLPPEINALQAVTYRIVCNTDASGVETRTLVKSFGYDLTQPPDGTIDKFDVTPVASDIEDLQVEFLYDLTVPGDDLPDEPQTNTAWPASDFDRERVKAMRVTVVARTARVVTPNTATLVGRPIDMPGLRPNWPAPPGSPPYGALYRYGRRLLRETILLTNRNTRDPSSFNPMSNRYL